MIQQLQHNDEAIKENKLHSRMIMQINYLLEETFFIYIDWFPSLHSDSQLPVKICHTHKKVVLKNIKKEEGKQERVTPG